MTDPRPVEERALVDHVGARAQRVERGRLTVTGVRRPGDLDDAQATVAQVLEVGGFVLVALGEDELQRIIGGARNQARVTLEPSPVERGDMRARHMLGQVGRAQDDAPVDALHGVSMPGGTDSPS